VIKYQINNHIDSPHPLYDLLNEQTFFLLPPFTFWRSWQDRWVH